MKNRKVLMIVLFTILLLSIAFAIGRKNSYEKNIKENWYYNLAIVDHVSLNGTKEGILCNTIYNYNWYINYIYENKHYSLILEEKSYKIKDENVFKGVYLPIYINPENPKEAVTFSFDIEIISN